MTATCAVKYARARDSAGHQRQSFDLDLLRRKALSKVWRCNYMRALHGGCQSHKFTFNIGASCQLLKFLHQLFCAYRWHRALHCMRITFGNRLKLQWQLALLLHVTHNDTPHVCTRQSVVTAPPLE
jgi:hypothetical protein